MREVVTSGTGRVLAANRTPIAGKTGTAEVDGAPQGVAEKEMKDAADQVGRRVEERPAFPVEAGQGVEGA